MDFSYSIVVPLFNESSSFQFLIERLTELMNSTNQSIEVVLIDDGSSDDTSFLMAQQAMLDERFQCVFLSRNFGHQIAISAGLAHANGKIGVMIIDGDLQDPPELINDFIIKLNEGYEIVYAIRKKRKEHIGKRIAYKLFYRIQKQKANIDIKLDSGDFCLMSRRVVDILNELKEESRFVRGLRSWVGFKQIGIEYERSERKLGKTKYSIGMLMRLAYNGIFNFSDLPVKYITRLGIFSMVVAIIYLIITLILKYFYHDVPSGFTGLLAVIVLFGGAQLVSIGIIGEYLIRIFFQVKNRPLYIVDKKIVDKKLIKL
ncbi:MAG: glycosyltransferase family 2 protein [Bacteroidetes bacterium]|nr:glycosyltransferase family 2 protein [Bacteroidota bacterium]